jgi:hypothetical protein
MVIHSKFYIIIMQIERENYEAEGLTRISSFLWFMKEHYTTAIDIFLVETRNDLSIIRAIDLP